MAPNGDAAVAQPRAPQSKPRRISMGGLQRAMSDLALEFMISKDIITGSSHAAPRLLPAVSEQQDPEVGEARCECCGMTEECTAEYAARVRERHCGRLVCGLCAAAVSGGLTETETTTMEEALAKHMGVCGRFNRVGRANPVLMQTEAMRDILRKSRAKSTSPRDGAGAGAGRLARSSSCISAITKDLNCVK